MFSLATNFNQNLCGWDTSQVTDLEMMFEDVYLMFDDSKCPYESLTANTKCQSCT